MKKLLLIISVVAFVGCKKDGDKCVRCYAGNGQLVSKVCEEDLDGQTIEEYHEYYNAFAYLNCHLDN